MTQKASKVEKVLTIHLSESEQLKVDTLQQKKQKLQEERDKLFAKIDKIDFEIIKTQRICDRIHNKHVPILKLPTEITCIIFTFSSAPSRLNRNKIEDSDDEELEEDTGHGDSSMEVVISQVCNQWRKTALKLPTLWTHIWFDGPNSKHVSLRRIRAYIKRSASSLLDMRLDLREKARYPLSDNMVRRYATVLQLAIAHVARWWRVAILADVFSHVPPLLPQLRPLCAPNLEYLALTYDGCGPDRSETDLVPSATIFDGGAPKLVYAWMDGNVSSLCLPPLSSITTLRIEKLGAAHDAPWPWRVLLDILTIPSLTNLSLAGTIFEDPNSEEMNTIIITLNSLRHLRCSGSDVFVELLPHLRAAYLETLTLQECKISRNATISSAGVADYFFPSLTELTLLETDVDDPTAALSFVHLTRAVTKLLLSNDEPDECILDIVPQIHDRAFWPNLEVITCSFDWANAGQPEDRFFVKMALGRSESGAKKLTYRIPASLLAHWRSLDSEEVGRLNKLCVVEEVARGQLLRRSWPPGDELAEYMGADADEDPFAIEISTDSDYDEDSEM